MKRAMRRRKTWQRQAAAITAAMMAMSVGGIAYAMPQGEVIRSGKGEITRQDKDMTVNQDSKRLAIDWSGFDIANDERVTFRQPDKDSVALNRVVGDAASVIDGTLSGNGHVYVINPNGVLFGKNASVDVGSLVASTARISDSDMTNFANADGITMAIPEDSSAKVINAGTIRAEGGLVVLHAAEVENSGTITNPEGTTALAAARNLSLSADTAGKINFTVDGALAKAKALNSGVLKADGGYLVMTARSAGDVMSTVVNNTGTMEAKTLRQNEKGEILLDGGDNGIVELNGTLDASGMEAGQSAGSIKAIGAETHVEDGATLHAIGAVDGGLIETSGDYLEIGDNVDIDAAGKTGKAGEWLLDPLEVVISNSQPSGSSAVTNGNTDGSYNSSNDASGTASRNKTTWVNSNTVNRLLNKGTAVSVQATDANKVASITLDSAINKTSGADTSLTLEAQRNVTVNAGIKSTSGVLDVNLHSDTDGDGLGAVLINADIATNGGTFTSGSGTTIKSGSVGTYFGNQGEMGDRHVTTNGGAINLYGDVAIGLNGGTLTLDTKNKTTGASGAVKVTGTVDSGNSYKRVASGLEGWTDFVKSYYDEVMSDEDKYTAPTYTLRRGAEQYPASEYYPKYVLNSDGTVSQITSGSGYRWRDLQATGNTVTLSSYDELSASQKDALSSNLATLSKTWAGAKAMAQGATKGTNNTGDTYLATITTALENSLASPPEEYQLIVGGQGSGDATRLNPHPADPSHPDGYYWVTGPEGMANNGKGTKFAYNDGSAVDNYYVKWNYSYSQDTKKKEKEPNNSGPIVSIGFGTESKWDDVLETAGTIRGFVQEKNLEHSGLVINAGDSKVDIAGNIGNSVALKNVEINAGDVAIGSGEHYTGIVHSDEGVSITGKDVTVGDRITADTKGVDIQATGDIYVDGITSHENINLTTTDGSIVLDKEHNDGSLHTDSQDNDAVVIDVQGAGGSFRNLTSADVPAIKTGTGGNWKVYSYSPDADKFGTNLNSYTNAQWGATSATYSASENDGNKYIFQVQPKLTVTAEDKEKTYGVELSDSDLTVTKTATFKGQNGKDIDVHNYSQAFQEGDVMNHYTGTINVESAGAAAAATRTGGVRTADDNNKAIYDITVSGNLEGKDGYGAPEYVNGNLKINRRTVTLNGSATQTYGVRTLNNKTVYAENGTGDTGLYGNDKLDTDKVEYSISTTGKYAAKKGDRVTADAGTYTDELEFRNVHVVNGTTDMDANYTFTGNGDITVDKHTITRNELGLEGSPLYTTVYGTRKPLGTATFHGANGDGSYELEITGTNALTGNVSGKVTNDVGSNYYTTVKLSDALSDNYKFDNGETSKAFENTASVTPAKLTIESKGFNATYGEVEAVQKGLENAAKITGLTNGDGAATMIVDGTSDALITEGSETRTNNVKKDGYDINASIPENLANIINKKNKNYEITENLGKVLLQKRTARLSTDDIHTKYGDGDTIYNKLAENNLLHLDNLASWDTESDILKQIKAKTTVEGNRSAFKLNADGTTIATDSEGHRYTNDVRAYSITTSWFGSQNYNVEKVANENGSSGNIYVDPADLIVYRKGIETVYGTVKKDPGDMTTYTTLVNGDKNDIVIDNGNYGTAYNDDLTKTNNVGKYDYKATLNSASDVLRNYNVIDKGTNYVNITPLNITEDNVNDFITNATYTTVYGSKADFGQAVFTGVNGDGTRDLSITGSSALTGNTEGVITEDAAKNAYDTVVSLDGLSAQDKKNYGLEDTSSFTFDNSATVEKADLTVTRKGIETVYGTVKKDPGDMTTYTTLVNGDKNDIVIDNGNYGTAYNDDLTKTNNVGKYDYKATLNSASDVLRNYNVIDKGTNYVNITPLNITEDNVNDFITNATYTTVYGSKADFGQAVFTGVNGDGTRDLSITGSSALTGNTEGVITEDAAKNAYDTVVSLDGLSAQDKKNYGLEDTSSFTFDNSATVEKADLTVSRKGIETVYGTVKKDPGDMTTYTTLVNGDTNDIVIDNGNYGTAYNDDLTKTNNVGKYDYKATLNSASDVLRNYNVIDKGTNYVNITPLNITEDNVNDFITNATYTTVYGSKADFGQAVFTGVNGDGTRDLSITGSSALTGNTEGVITEDAAKNAYDTVVSLDGLSAQDKKNYGLEDTSSFTFDNSATVEKADLTVSRKGIETVYGTVKKDPGDMTTYTDLVNGDTNDIVIDNGNYGTAYNDELTKTNNVGKYNYKATLNSESDVLRNYDVHDDGTNYVNITPLNITEDNVNDFITNATYTTVYGSKADFGQAVFTGVNGDGTRDLSITGSSALTGNTEGVITEDAAKNAYDTVVSLDGLSAQDKKNYGLEDTSSFTFDNSATVEKADLTVTRKGIETVYGTVKTDPGDMTTYTKLVNGDMDDIAINNGNYGTAYNDELTKTNNVGKYNYKATLNSESDVLRNYNVHDDGTNYVNITPYTITDQEVVNLDGSPLYTTKYGQKDAFGTATFTGVNGDGTYELAITDSSALATAGAGKVTQDVGKNIYDTTVELSEAMNGNYQFADGATSKTFEKTASVTPAELTIKTKDVETEYGTVKTTTSEVEGLVNGDLPTGFIYDYGNYGGAYLDGNTKTNDVNTYHFGTTLSGAEFLKNYTITGGEADVKIDPKDVTFFVSGTGNTLTDVTYTVDPDIDAQLAYGEHVDADYTPGNDLGSNQYGVVAHINGTPIVTGDVAGNYRYNYGGLITLSPTVPTKPDIDPHNPSNLDGSGSWTSNMGNHGVPGVERVAGLASAELPFFKVEAGQVSHYGTYDVAADPDKVRLEPTGKRLPEPNQPKTQYREYTKALTTTDGTGMFRMVYDGSTFNITPVDDGALALMRMGDVKNNVELSAEALHAGFSEMGILLEDLDGVYVHFDTMA